MKQSILLILAILSLMITGCDSEVTISVDADAQYPRWLRDTGVVALQTSGIAFIGSSENKKQFFLADDIGKIHRLTITDDTVFTFETLQLSPQVENTLAPFPKRDFEDIAYDRKAKQLYLSVEGNGPDHKKFTKIFKVGLSGTPDKATRITSLKPLDITPKDELLRHVAPNSGFEGLAVDDKYLYLGLEGFRPDVLFSDSTMIYIVDKKSLTIEKIISTREYGVGSITGLYCDAPRSVYVLDRNNRRLLHLNLSDKLNVMSTSSVFLDNPIPGYPSLKYIMALESITFDDKHNAYMIDDPWTSFFVPGEQTLSQLDSVTIKNFEAFVPIIHKYSIKKTKH